MMKVSIQVGDDMGVMLEVDAAYSPDVCSDLCARAAATASTVFLDAEPDESTA